MSKNLKTKITLLVAVFMLSYVGVNAQIKFNRNIPNEAHKKITQLLPKRINDFSFSPNGGWVIVTKTNQTFARNIPNECYTKIKYLKNKGHKIQQVSFPPKGGSNSWIIITDKSTFARNIPKECHAKIQEFKKKGKRIKSVSFPYKNVFNSSNNAWVIVTTDGSFFAKNIPDECYQILRNLTESDMPGKRAARKINKVSFTPSGGWVVFADDYFFARNIPDEAFKKLKSFQKSKYKPHIIAFTPNGKGWSLIANDKYSRAPKDLIRKFESDVAGKSIWQVMRENNVPGVSVAVVINGRIAWSTSYGHLQKGNKKYAAHPESMFQAASISKVYAALGVHKLVDQRKVSLTENLLTSGKLKTKISLHECLDKDDFKDLKSVTVENILQHKSGIEGRGALIDNCDNGTIKYKGKNKKGNFTGGGYGGYKSINSVPKLGKLMESVKITYNPSDKPNGESDWYSGPAFTTLQKLTEDVTNKTYPSWMKSNILNPLKMNKSRFTIKPENYYKPDNLARGHNESGNMFKIQRYPQYAAAGLYTNALELANMIIMINNDGVFNKRRVLSSNAMDNLIKKDMGIYVTSAGNYLHGGTNTGFKTYFSGYPKIDNKESGINNAGIVVLTNGDNNIRELVKNAIKKAYGW